jgi:hypothetical protein
MPHINKMVYILDLMVKASMVSWNFCFLKSSHGIWGTWNGCPARNFHNHESFFPTSRMQLRFTLNIVDVILNRYYRSCNFWCGNFHLYDGDRQQADDCWVCFMFLDLGQCSASKPRGFRWTWSATMCLGLVLKKEVIPWTPELNDTLW